MAFSYDNYTGNGTTTQFSITFTYQDTSEISVTVDGVAETGLTFPSASTVQLTSAPASGTLVQVRRTTDLSARAVDFASGSVLTEEDLDDSNIQVFHAAQESVDLAADSIQLDNDNKWDAQSSVIKNVGTPTASTDAATKGYTDTEVSGVVSSAVSQATTAAVSAANTAVATATGSIIPDATKLAIHPIGTQYTLSDGVTSDFSSKHYANVASTNATTATNAASTASTDAGTASSAATAAQVAQAAAEAALDTFDDRFLGAKASDPSVDNDGNALLDGAIYFNTTSDIMKVYDQANTIWRDLALTGTDQTNVNLVAGQISPTNNIATVAGISSDITTVAGNNANVTTVANSISDVNAVGTDIANVNTVATNLSSVNAFADTYFVSATAPALPTLGDLWFDTTNNVMKVYSASGFVNAGSSVNGTANRYVYTATASQTTFAATYDAGYIDVYLNGVKLQNGTDFTATDGANVVLTVGAALNDQIDIVGYGTFNIAIPDISGDATPQLGGNLDLNGNDITGTGDIDITGTVTADGLDVQGDGTISGGSRLTISDIADINNDGIRLDDNTTGRFNNLTQDTSGNFKIQHWTGSAWQNNFTLSTTGSVGIGTSLPASPTGFGTGGILHLKGSTGNDASIVLEGLSGSGGRQEIGASGGALQFYRGAATGSMTESMRIDSSGNLLVGTTSNTIYSSSGEVGSQIGDGYIAAARAAPVAYLNRLTTDGGIVDFRKDGTTVGSIGTFSGNAYFAGSGCGLRPRSGDISPTNASGSTNDGGVDLGTSSNRFNNIFLSGGVYLGGTGSANHLDDYEEGTWTPEFVNSAGANNCAAANGLNGAYYTKIGNQVTCSFRWNKSGGLAVAAYLAGLPYAPAGASGKGVNIVIIASDNSADTTLIDYWRVDGVNRITLIGSTLSQLPNIFRAEFTYFTN